MDEMWTRPIAEMIAVGDLEDLDIFEILIGPNHVQKIELDIHRMLFENIWRKIQSKYIPKQHRKESYDLGIPFGRSNIDTHLSS